MTTPETGFARMSEAGRQLEAAGIDNGRGDAMALIAYAYGDRVPRYALMGILQDPLPEDVAARFEAAIAARLTRQPVSQIIGRRAFWRHEFIVTPDVLDPRPDTETLVAQALEEPFTRLLDLGTGSGAIAISLLAERPQAKGLASDLSAPALEVARRNAAATGVLERLELCQSNWFCAIDGQFDLIVSNPPYISASEMDALSPEVRDWEPQMALTPGGDGLSAYREIAAGAADHLTPGGWLMVEIGWQQGPAVSEIFRQHGLEDVSIRHDLDGRDRVVRGRKARIGAKTGQSG